MRSVEEHKSSTEAGISAGLKRRDRIVRFLALLVYAVIFSILLVRKAGGLHVRLEDVLNLAPVAALGLAFYYFGTGLLLRQISKDRTVNHDAAELEKRLKW